MTISVVQSKNIPGSWSGSFATNVSAGNTVFFFGFQYGSSGGMSSSSPLFGGSSVAGAVKLFDGQNSGGSDVYGTIWMLPDLAGGAASVALTNSGGTVDSNVGSAAIEVSGLGTSPGLDSGTPNPETGNGTSGTVLSGSTGALAAAAAVILAAAVQYGSDPGAQGSPWTDLQPSSFCRAVWQVVTSSGGTYEFSGNTDGVPGWFAGVAAVRGAAGVSGTVSLAAAPMKLSAAAAERMSGTLALAAAPMRLSAAAAERMTGAAGLALAPMKLADTGAALSLAGAIAMALAPMGAHATAMVTQNVTGALSLAAAPMKLAGSAHVPRAAGSGGPPYHHREGGRR